MPEMPRRYFQILCCLLALAGCERSPETFAPPLIGAVHVTAGYDSVTFGVETEGSFLDCGVFFGISPETATPVYGVRTETGFSLTVDQLEEGTGYWFQPFVGNGRENVVAAGAYVTTEVYPFVRIPDPVFKAWLVEHFDENGDGEISPSEARAVKTITCTEGNGVRSLKGIEAFTALYRIEWGNDLFEEVDLSRNLQIEDLNLNRNRLRSVVFPAGPRLKFFWGEDNEFESLDFSGYPNLQSISLARNPLQKVILPENNRLEYLWLYDTELSEVDLSGCSKLTYLTVHGNYLTELDLSPCPQLLFLHCGWNNLERLNLTGLSDLKELHCNDNAQLGPVLDLTTQDRLTIVEVKNCPRLQEIWIKKGAVMSIIKDGHTKIIEKSEADTRADLQAPLPETEDLSADGQA